MHTPLQLINTVTFPHHNSFLLFSIIWQVNQDNWVSCGILMLGAMFVFFTIATMESHFKKAERSDVDVTTLLVWRKVNVKHAQTRTLLPSFVRV
jgi:Zn-dependent membrane protease YugP